MIIEEIGKVKKISAESGYVLSDGETVTDVIFININSTYDQWFEIPEEEIENESQNKLDI